MNYNLITILGPTAVGKTRLAVKLAYHFNGEIISADSRQVYKSMDIGTGKDLSDYIMEGEKIPYHLIDVIEPTEEFNLFLFNQMFYDAYHKITSKKKIPFLTGGTGLYLHSILKGYLLEKVNMENAQYDELSKLSIEELTSKLKMLNPNLHNTTDLKIKDRVIKAIIIAQNKNKTEKSVKKKINSLTIGVKLDREKLKERITERLKHRLNSGMVEEVKNLLANGISYDKLIFFGLEYRYIAQYLKGELNYNDMFQKLNSAIHNFAKRQMTWFRKMEREGIKIHWIEGPNFELAKKIIEENYS
ncbi:tRNA (adenosine(37)-N6)-dimethylallyltransferase MiaA [Melioribacteraceae bacterium 4301-Me]|uniref:tRNA (adenosine(37)-N6)-dimethylallyltransferase MiaA n=1 Tax=Pyranulibacter aquaticus TaxID=3163344 RepID=UPI003597B0C5